jgi:23S rRNA (uridine2552-2'-O)-methyltransferase
MIPEETRHVLPSESHDAVCIRIPHGIHYNGPCSSVNGLLFASSLLLPLPCSIILLQRHFGYGKKIRQFAAPAIFSPGYLEPPLAMSKTNKWEDHYTRRARQENWLARSVYKLEEIDRKYKLIRPGGRILDLGCYPGSWSQYCIRKAVPNGEVVGVDLREPERLRSKAFRFIKADVLTLDTEWLVGEIGRRDVVISDLAPSTSGIAVADVSRSLELAWKALAIALSVLRKKGHFLCKVFEGEGAQDLRREVSSRFDQMRIIRPSAVRKASREMYFLGLAMDDPSVKGE